MDLDSESGLKKRKHSNHTSNFEKQTSVVDKVIHEIGRKGTHLYEPIKSVQSPLIVILLGLYCLLGFLTQLVEDEMPRVILDSEIARDNSETFSEESARRFLEELLGDEPRVAGTRYHLTKTADLKDLLDGLATQAALTVRTDWQYATGDYLLGLNTYPHVNYYQNLSNIMALLEGESGYQSDGSLGTTLLVNCHYDSVPYAIGASDDGLLCSVMIESLKRLSRRHQKLKHNIVFLFNGAEENPLQGAHGFLQHPWSRNVISVINLDAAGTNGKANIFQVTDTRILAIYARNTNRPSAQSMGEFLFSSGIIPSDTDFRIWRDFGGFTGVDIAMVKWGHVYHTRYDNIDSIKPGVIQAAGEMLLPLITEMADSTEFTTKIPDEPAVYYDYLNSFVISYSLRLAPLVDVLVALFGLCSVFYFVWLVGIRMSTIQELMFAVLGRVASLLAGLLAGFILQPIVVATGLQLRYLTQPWIAVPSYWVPYFIAAVCVAQAFDSWRTKKSGLNRCIRTLQSMAATRLILSVILLVTAGISSLATIRYLFTVPLFIMSVASLVSLTVVRYVRLQGWQHLVMEASMSLPSVMFLLSVSLRVNALMMPTMGRTPSAAPDYVLALLNVGLAAVTGACVSGIELLFSRKRLWMVASALGAVCVIIMFIPMNPYSDNGPSTQRHYWFHSEIITYDAAGAVTERSSGVLVTPHDAYNTDSAVRELRAAGLTLTVRDDFTDVCNQRLWCDLPLYRLRFGQYLSESVMLSTGPPAYFDNSLQLTSRVCVADSCTLTFTMTGPAHNTLTLWPRANVSVSSWSLASEVPARPTLQADGRPVYAIIESTATYSDVFQPLVFSVTFQVPQSLQSGVIVDVGHHAHKIHHPEDFTAEYRNIISHVPPYFHISHNLSIRSNYVF